MHVLKFQASWDKGVETGEFQGRKKGHRLHEFGIFVDDGEHVAIGADVVWEL